MIDKVSPSDTKKGPETNQGDNSRTVCVTLF